jgi:hypothetical protein
MKEVKMRKIVFLLGCIFTGAVNATPISGDASGLTSPGTLLTFDEVVLATDASVTNEYSAYGVTFSGLFYDSSCCIEIWDPDGASPYLGNITTSTSNYRSWSILFSQDQTEAAFTMASNTATHILSAYLDNTLVESFSVNGSSWGYYGFTGIVFDELRMQANQAMLIDNLQFSTTPIPEPASIALLGLGLAGIGYSRRKTC